MRATPGTPDAPHRKPRRAAGGRHPSGMAVTQAQCATLACTVGNGEGGPHPPSHCGHWTPRDPRCRLGQDGGGDGPGLRQEGGPWHGSRVPGSRHGPSRGPFGHLTVLCWAERAVTSYVCPCEKDGVRVQWLGGARHRLPCRLSRVEPGVTGHAAPPRPPGLRGTGVPAGPRGRRDTQCARCRGCVAASPDAYDTLKLSS